MGERSGLRTHIATIRKRFVVRADEKLTAFLELEAAISPKGWTLLSAKTFKGLLYQSIRLRSYGRNGPRIRTLLPF
jgi:hypothetical protein